MSVPVHAMRRASLVAGLLALAFILAAAPAAADKPDDAPGSRTGTEPTHGPGAGGRGEGKPEKPAGGEARRDGGDAGTQAQADGGDPSAASNPAPAPSSADAQGDDAPATPGHDGPRRGGSDATPAAHADGDAPGASDGAGTNGQPSSGERPDAAGGSSGEGSDEDPAAGAADLVPVDAIPVPLPDAVRLHAGDQLLAVRRAAGEARLAWTVPADADQVQLWRNDGAGAGWVAVAAAARDGAITDPDAQATSEYRLTWTTRTLAGAELAAAASALPLVPALPGGSPVGAGLLALLWAGVAGFATVRAPGARPVPDARVGPDNQLMPALTGLPGIDHAALDRVVGLGVRTVGQLRALDPEALAFWARIPTATVRRWHDALDLLQWPALPAGAAHRLARAGAPTLADVAAADPERLWADLRQGVVTAGPGLPADMPEVASWVAEARQLLGLGAATPAPGVAGRLTVA